MVPLIIVISNIFHVRLDIQRKRRSILHQVYDATPDKQIQKDQT